MSKKRPVKPNKRGPVKNTETKEIEAKPVEVQRTKLDPAAFLAAELHSQRDLTMSKAEENLALHNQVLDLRKLVLKKDAVILKMKRGELERSNKTLREQFGLRVGQTLRKDDDTGEVFYEDQVAAQAEDDGEPEVEFGPGPVAAEEPATAGPAR